MRGAAGHAAHTPRIAPLPPLILVTDRHRTAGRPLVPLVAAGAHAGVRFVLLRERDLDDDALAGLASELLRAVPSGTIMAVSGSPVVARRLGIGLHLGAGVSAPFEDRTKFPLFGRSVHSAGEAWHACLDRPDYLIVGTMYATASKPGRMPEGPGVIGAVRDRLPQPRPGLYAIGGVTAARVAELIASGADGIAVTAAILGAADPAAAAGELIAALDGVKAKEG